MIFKLLFACLSFAAFPQFDSSWGLSPRVYESAKASYAKHNFKSDYALVADFSQHSSKRRLYVFSLNTGNVERYNVAHGSGSDKNNDGIAETFSNVSGSHMSSLGAYRVAETYTGKHGLSVKLDGLDSTNSNARRRAIVMHPATYVVNGIRAGRSQGCPAIDHAISKSLILRAKNGAFLFIGK